MTARETIETLKRLEKRHALYAALSNENSRFWNRYNVLHLIAFLIAGISTFVFYNFEVTCLVLFLVLVAGGAIKLFTWSVMSYKEQELHKKIKKLRERINSIGKKFERDYYEHLHPRTWTIFKPEMAGKLEYCPELFKNTRPLTKFSI